MKKLAITKMMGLRESGFRSQILMLEEEFQLSLLHSFKKLMSQIKRDNTKPEETVRKYLFSKGLRYRKNDTKLPGTPDIVLKKYKTVVFVNGCFWHKHDNCKYFTWPKTNVEFWEDKITKNVERDKYAHELLEKNGWKVIVVWECELKKELKERTLSNLYNLITTFGGY